MRTMVRISIFLLTGLALLVILAWLVIFKTQPGIAFIEQQIRSSAERVALEQYGSDVSIGTISGQFPENVTLVDVNVSTDDGIWLQVERIDLAWSPLALLRRRIVINKFSISSAELFKLPPQTEKDSTDNGGLSLPPDLPWIDVKDLSVNRFGITENVFGNAREFSLAGKFSSGRNDLISDIKIVTPDNSDDLSVVIESTEKSVGLDISANSSAEGILAFLLNEDNQISFSLKGDGPRAAWSGKLAASSNNLGQFNFALDGDFGNQPAFAMRGQIVPGQRVPAQAKLAIGEELAVALSVSPSTDMSDVVIERVTGAFGTISGTINDIRLNSAGGMAGIDLTVLISELYAADTVSQLAGETSLSGDVQYKNGTTTGAGLIKTSIGVLDIAKLRINEEEGLLADVRVEFNPSITEQGVIANVLEDGAQATARLTMFDDLLSWQDLSLTSGRSPGDTGLLFKGSGTFHLEQALLAHNGTVEVQPALIRQTIPAVSMTRPLVADVSISGLPTALSISADAVFDRWVYADTEFSGGRFSVDVSDLPTAPSGTASITADGNEYAARVDIKSPDNSTLLLDDIAVNLLGLSLTGNLQQDRAAERLSMNFDIITNDIVVLPNGRELEGRAAMTAMIGTGTDQPVTVTLNADQLRVDSIASENLALRLTGKFDNLQITMSGENLRLPGDQFLDRYGAGAQLVRSDDTTTLNLATLSAQTSVEGEAGALRLASPTQISLSNGVFSLDETRIIFAGDTKLDLSGEYSNRRFVANADGENILLPFLEAPLSFEILVDTEAEEMANAIFAGTVTDQNGLRHNLQMTSIWKDGLVTTEATISNGGERVAGDLNLRFPLQLKKEERLRLGTDDGRLVGRLTYDDVISPLRAFLPLDTDLIEGRASADVIISGTIERPDISGGIQLTGGRYEERNTGALVSDITGDVVFSVSSDGSEGIFELKGSDAEGQENRINLSGSVALGKRADGDLSVVNGKLVLDRATLINSRELTASASSDLDLSGSLSDMVLSGTIDIRKIDALIPSTEQKQNYVPVNIVRVDDSGDVLSTSIDDKSKLLTLALDIVVAAKDELFIRGRGLQSEWKGAVKISGSASSPRLAGEVETVKGSLDFAGRKFEITRGRILFAEGVDRVADLDIVAEYEATVDQGSAKAIVTVSGSSTNPSVKISSVPSLPQDQVMALILFGKDPSALSAFETLRIAEAITELSGAGILGGEGLSGIIRRLGLDALNFGQDAATGIGTVSIGKYVSDDLYVSATQGLGTKGSVSVTYDLHDKVSVETTVEQDGAQSVSANYKRDY